MKNNTENLLTIDECYEKLIAAILRQAIREYLVAVRKNNFRGMMRLESWFLSEWGQALSYGHGEFIIEKCKRDCRGERSL